MDLSRFTRVDDTTWRIEPQGAMRVPAVIYADENLIRVGFDISCGVRTMLTGLKVTDVLPVQKALADSLYRQIPAGVGSTGAITLDMDEMDAMLAGGAQWAVERGWGEARDLDRIEEGGCMAGAKPENVSDRAKKRQHKEMGTLGSGNHYLEVQAVTEIFDVKTAEVYALQLDDVVVTIHCGSRGLGHQIGTEFLKEMVVAAQASGIALPDRELACALIKSEIGERYLGAMRAGINCALANREILGYTARRVFGHYFPNHQLDLLFDVSHNTCKVEPHRVDGKRRELFVHRKGATRAFGPGHESLPDALRAVGQPVLIGGSMGTGSYILVGETSAEQKAFSSACHGAGRAMSRHAALKQWSGRKIQDDLAAQGILIKSPSTRGIAEEAPSAYKDVSAVVLAAEHAGLARRVARLRPLICIKG
jgi:tRNA-splicing ligase RtcB